MQAGCPRSQELSCGTFGFRFRMLTICAITKDSQTVMSRLKLVFIRYLVLHVFYGFTVKLDQFPATHADKVIVMLVFVVVLVTSAAVAEIGFARQSGIHQ